MSECSLTVESLRRHLPFLNKVVAQMKGKQFFEEFQQMKNVIECGKKLSPIRVQKLEASIVTLRNRLTYPSSSSGSGKKTTNNKNNQMDVICISSDEEASTSTLPYHKEQEVVEIKTTEPNLSNGHNNQAQQIIIKPERPDVEIIMTTIQTHNITPDTDSQKITIKPERCEVETIIKEVKLTTDHNGNSQQNNSNTIDLVIKEEEPESDIEDYKTVYSGSSDESETNAAPEPIASQITENDDDEVLPPPSAKRKRRKISSSSEEIDIEITKNKSKRRRIVENSDSSDDERVSEKSNSTSSNKRKRSTSSSSGSEFYSAESVKSSDASVKTSTEDDTKTLEGFRETIMVLSTERETTDTIEIVNLVTNFFPDTEVLKLIKFLQKCCETGLLNLDISGPSRNRNDRTLEEFVNLTLSSTRLLRNRVIVTNDKKETSSYEENSKSSDNSILDFSDDQDYQCYLNKSGNPPRKQKVLKKTRCRKRVGELEKLKEDIDKSFIKPALLTLKPREHKNVDYNIDNKTSTSDDSDAFVNSIPKDKREPLKKKKRGRKKRSIDSNSPKIDQDNKNECDESDSEIGLKRPTQVKRLEESDSNRTTPDNLVIKPIETVKNEDFEGNRSTPDIDIDNDPRVVSFEKSRNSLSDEDIDTECSSGETLRDSPKNILPLLDEDEDEDENNPKFHFITVEKITACRVDVNKLEIVYKPEPYKVHFENGVWKIGNTTFNEKSTKPSAKNSLQPVVDIKPIPIPLKVQTPSKDQPNINEPEVMKIVEKTVIEHPIPIKLNKTQVEEIKEKEDPKNIQIAPESPSEKINNALEDKLFYDPILSESDDEFINMEPDENIKDHDFLEETVEQDEKPVNSLSIVISTDNEPSVETKDLGEKPIDALPDQITTDPLNNIISSVTEEKYKIQNLYDPISSDSDDDALHIDMEAKPKENEKETGKNKENNNLTNEPDNNQHPVSNNEAVENNSIQNKITESNPEEFIIIEDSDEIIPDNKIQEQSSPIKPKISVIPANTQNSKSKDVLNEQSNLSTLAEKPPSTQENKTVLQKTPQKNNVQRVSPNSLRRKCSPMSKLLTENERKVLNLSYISCRGGYQFRCINSCKYYNLREEAFKYHIQSRHAIDKWAGFCNLCGKSFSKEIRPLIDEYQHMIEYHIVPEHDQRISTKENIDVDDEKVNDINDSDDSDCIIVSQPSESESNVPEQKATTKHEKVDRIAQTIEPSDNNLKETENTNTDQDITEPPNQPEMPPNEQAIPTDTVLNVQQVPQNIPENPSAKQVLRVKSLPGDMLSGKNDENRIAHEKNLADMINLNSEMTFGELTELERIRKDALTTETQRSVQESNPNHITPPMTPLPEGCVPETTAEQEATLQAVIEENISRYAQINVQPQQPVMIRASLRPTIQPNSIILHTTSNALVTYTPPVVLYNRNMNNVPTTHPVTNLTYQTSFINHQSSAIRPQRIILPNPSYPVRPTASIAPSPKNNSSDLEIGIPSTVIIPNANNNTQNTSTYVNTATTSANFMNTVQRPMQVPMQNLAVSIQNQSPSTSHGTASRKVTSINTAPKKIKSLRPWLDIEDLKASNIIENCFDSKYLGQLYKCMFVACNFATNNAKDFYVHLKIHKNTAKNPIFCCSYCTYNTVNEDDLMLHITTKYNRCNFYCSRCFYRTCSQYNALQHTTIHKHVGSTKVFIVQNIQTVSEEQEFNKINLRELPSMKCINCPQIFRTYDQFRLHVKLCCVNPNIICNKCNKNEPIKNLEEHQTKCHGVYTYNCCYCLYGTQDLDAMSNHVVHTHMEKIPFYFERSDTSHLTNPLLIKAAVIKKFAGRSYHQLLLEHGTLLELKTSQKELEGCTDQAI